MYNEFNIGDIITTYHSGYWRLLKIDKRFITEEYLRYYSSDKKIGDAMSPIFTYEKIANEDFKPVFRSKNNSCDAVYCKKVKKEYIIKIKFELNENIDKFLKLL